MEIDVAQRSPDGATLILPLADPPGAVPEGAEGISDLLSAHEASTERGSARLVRVDGKRVVAAGLGPRDDLEPDALRDAAAAAIRELRRSIGGAAAWPVDETLPLAPAEQIRAVIEGAVLGGYDPGAWKTAAKKAQPVERLTLVGASAGAEADTNRAGVVAAWTNYARDLANAPASELTPVTFADRAAELSARFDTVVAEALDPDEMRERMGALLGVGMGSHNPPRLIVLRHEPAQPAKQDLVLGLVGKGITFDSGGIALKPALYMEDMRGDMSGAAAVVGATGAIAELGLPIRVLTAV